MGLEMACYDNNYTNEVCYSSVVLQVDNLNDISFFAAVLYLFISGKKAKDDPRYQKYFKMKRLVNI